MTKDDLKWEIESKLRVGISYSGSRYSFFSKLNIVLCFVSLVSLWLSGAVFAGDWPNVSLALNVVCSLSLVLDVVLNVKGTNGYWAAMYDGYNDMLSGLFRIQEKCTVEQLSELRSRMYAFDGRCKSTLNVLCVVAWNEACIQMGRPQYVKQIHWFKRWTANLFSWDPVEDYFK